MHGTSTCEEEPQWEHGRDILWDMQLEIELNVFFPKVPSWGRLNHVFVLDSAFVDERLDVIQ